MSRLPHALPTSTPHMHVRDLPFALQATDEPPIFVDEIIDPRFNINIHSVYRISGHGAPPDATQKFVTADRHDRANGFILLSSKSAPRMVERAVERARAVKAALPPPLDQAVLVPLENGTHEGRTYALFPIRRPAPTGSLRLRWQQLRYGTLVLEWLDQAVGATARPVSADALQPKFVEPLDTMRHDKRLPSTLRKAARHALSQLLSGSWEPKAAVMHNDFWWGNLVFDPRPHTSFYGVQIVDWAGAEVEGYPVYDLVRMAQSLRLSDVTLRHWLTRHASALGGELPQCRLYLCAALANLWRKREQFPVARYIHMAESVWRRLGAAID